MRALVLLVVVACGAPSPGNPDARPSPPAVRDAAPARPTLVDAASSAPPDAAVAPPDAGPPPAPRKRSWKPPAAQRAWFACQADADCKVVELGCCSCVGGPVLSANRAYVDQVTERYARRTGCPDARCPAVACRHTAICDSGTCARVERVPGNPRKVIANDTWSR